MKLDRKLDLNVLYQVCVFLGLSEKQHGGPGLWLAETFSTSPLKPLNGHQRNLIGSKITTSSTKFVFFGPIGKTRWPPWPLIGWDIFNFSSEAAERNSTKLTGSKISTSSTKFVFFGLMGKTRWPPWPLICLDIFDFSSETAERNSTKLDRKLDLNFLYQVCVFRADWKNKMATLASDWLRHFRLFLWNSGSEFNKTWQEARSQRPLPSLCFSGRSKKTRWPPWPLIGWDIFSAPEPKAQVHYCDHTLSVVCRPSSVVNFSHFRLLLWNRWMEFNETWQEARSQRPLPSLCFSGRSEKQDGRPGLWLAETFSTSPLKPLNGIQRNLTGSKISTSSPKFVFFGPIGKTRWPPWPLIGWDIFDFSSETAEQNSTKLDR